MPRNLDSTIQDAITQKQILTALTCPTTLRLKKGIIFGALDKKSIAWKVAELVKAEGGEIILTNHP